MNSFESSWMTEKVTPSQGSWEGEVSVGTWAVEIHNLICLQILFKLKQQVANCGGCTAEACVVLSQPRMVSSAGVQGGQLRGSSLQLVSQDLTELIC